ncbi:unnamed protein product, partial [Closterium sp. NIES-54]
MVQQVLQRFDFTYSSPQATPLSTRHSLSALPSDESVEPSGPYPELVGFLMYLMTCTRPDPAYPLSILARYVAPGRHRPEHMAAAKRVLRYLCSTSSCEAEIYARAMAAQELRWLTYLLTDLGEPPRSPPVLYVDNKAMLALCWEHRLEHRMKHIALRYFLARELQQRGQLRLAYVASQANTADIFTKALQPCDHQRFCTMLAAAAEGQNGSGEIDDLPISNLLPPSLFSPLELSHGLTLLLGSHLHLLLSLLPLLHFLHLSRSPFLLSPSDRSVLSRRLLPRTHSLLSSTLLLHTLSDSFAARSPEDDFSVDLLSLHIGGKGVADVDGDADVAVGTMRGSG